MKFIYNTYTYFIFPILLFMMICSIQGCKKLYSLPEELEFLSENADYTVKSFSPTLGRTNLYTGIFNSANSTAPLTFEIINPRFGDGRSAADMLEKKPVLVWTKEYTGLEKSLEEIEAKRKIELRPMVELRSSGDLVVWYSATSEIFQPRDSIVYPQDIRYMDVKITNSKGSKVIKELALTPYRERPYSPDLDINTYSGLPNTTTPGGDILVKMYPTISGMTGEGTNLPLTVNGGGSRGLVYLYIRKVPGGNGNSLRFKFLDKDSIAINPAKFNETKWDNLVHGFNRVMTDEYVKYDVAYPIPLAAIPTSYTTGGVNGSGTSAHVEFSYSRIGFGGNREIGKIIQDFRIFEKGDWEIVFHFKTVNPKFEDE